MARKYPLTTEGVRAKQEELFKLSDEKLQEQAVVISEDYKNWILQNFELTDEQLKTFDETPQDFNYIMGWQSASAIIKRDYVEFAQTQMRSNLSNGGNSPTIESTVEVGVDSNGKVSGKVGVKIKC